MTDAEELTVRRRGAVMWLTLNRPERRNALSAGLLASLRQALTELANDDDVRAVAITGAGRDAFCSGIDIKEQDDGERAGKPLEHPMRGVHRNIFETVLEFPKPTLAVLNGPAIGGGLELALACDLRVAAEHAWLCLPEARRGLGANFGSVLLPRLLAPAVALEMLYTGDNLDPARAASLGLINYVVAEEELQNSAAALLERIARNAPMTVRRYKQMVVKSSGLPVATALRLELTPDPYTSEDRVEGVRAFLERREPQWRNR